MKRLAINATLTVCLGFILAVTLFVHVNRADRTGRQLFSLDSPIPYPAANSHTAPSTTTVSITYNEPISSTTVSTRTFAVHAMQTGLLTQTYGVFNLLGTINLGRAVLTPTHPLHAGELVQVSATTGTLSLIDGQGPISPTVWGFRVAAPHGNGVFTDSGQNLGSSNSNAAVLGDLDGDGDLDAFVANWAQDNKLWLNNGGGTFSDSGQSLGSSYSNVSAMGDVDGDGDLDAFIAIEQDQPNEVWLNDGMGVFSDSGQRLGNADTHAVALGDLDGDGDLDVFVGNEMGQANQVWLNDGGIQGGALGSFWDSGQSLGGSDTWRVALGDLDGDGDLDAFVANGNDQANEVWLNNGRGIFSDSGQSLGSWTSGGVALGDVDGDGDLDAFVANGSDQANKLWLNNGSGTFIDSGQSLGSSDSMGVELGDLDGDGDLDAFVANVNEQANKVWLNDGGVQGGTLGNFSDSGQSLGNSHSSSVSLGDVDGDGDLDAFVANGGASPANKVWLNQKGIFLNPSHQAGVGAAGSTVDYTVMLVNHTGDTDSFSLAIQPGNAWTTTLSLTQTGTLSDGESLSFTVGVEIPPSASLGDVDSATIQATSVASPTVFSDTAVISTTASSLAYVTLSDSDLVALVDTGSHTSIGSVDVGAAGCDYPWRAAMSPDGDRVYVSCRSSGNVAVLETAGNTVVTMVGGIPSAGGIAFVRDGTYALVGSRHYSQIAVVDTAYYSVTNYISTPSHARSVAAHPYLDVAYATSGDGSVQVIDTTTFSIIAAVPVGSDPYDVAVSPDGGWVFAGSRWGDGLAVIAAGSNIVHTTVTGLGELTGLEVAPDGSVIYASGLWNGVHVLDGTTFSHITTIGGIGSVREVAVTCDGDELYVGNKGDQVPVVDTGTFSVADQIALPGAGAQGSAICPQARQLGLFLIPATQSKYADPGEVVVYEERLVNAIGQTASFTLSLSGNTWDTSLSITNTGPLSDGDVISFTVQVTIPDSASPGAADNVTIQATSVTSPTVYSDTAMLQTSVIGNLAYVTLSGSDLVALVDTTSHTVMDTVDVGAAGCDFPWRAAMSPDRAYVYVSCYDSGNVVVIETNDNTVVTTVDNIPSADGIAFTRDGTYALVGSRWNNQITIVDTATYFISTIPTPSNARSVSAHPYLDVAYATSGDDSVLVIDTTTFSIIATIPVGDDPWDVAVSPDGGWVFAGSRWGDGLAVVDASDNTLHTTVTGLGSLTGLDLAPDGSTIYAAGLGNGVYVIDGVTFSHTTTIPDVGTAWEVALTCDGSELYVGNREDQVIVIDTATLWKTQIAMPGSTTRGIAVCPGYVATGVVLSPPAQTNQGGRGEVVAHEEMLINLTGVTNAFNLTLGDYAWDTALSTHSLGPVADGDSLPFTVYVTVPVDADWYLTDTVVVSATSVASPTIYSDAATFTTQAYAPPQIGVAPDVLTSTQHVNEVATMPLTISNGNGVTGTFTILAQPHAQSFAVAGANADNVHSWLSSDPDLSDYTFTSVGDDWTYSSIQSYGGIIVDECDVCLSTTEATALRQFYESGKPVLFGMDDVDDLPSVVQDDVYFTFGVANAADGDFYPGVVNPDHPIGVDVTLQGTCCDNDHFTEDGAVWVVQGDDGNYYVLAHDDLTRSVIFGENLGQWWIEGNQQLIRNAINWVAAGSELEPWLAASPISGTVGSNSSRVISITFDATGLQPSTYTTQIIIQSNDPLTPTVSVPATMTVLPTANLGWVEGTVTDAGTGDPLEAAIVALGQPFTVTTNPDTGSYIFWLNEGSHTLQVTAEGYVTQTTVVSITAQQGITQDFAMVLNVPVLEVSPASLEVTHDVGDVTTQAMTITNNGPAPLTFELRESGIGYWPITAYVTLSNYDLVALVDTTTHTEIGTVDVGAAGCDHPWQAAMSPDGDYVYVGCRDSGNVAVIDTAGNTVVTTVGGIYGADGIAFTRDGSYALVGSRWSSQVAVVDTATYSLTTYIYTPSNARNVAAHPYLDIAYATSSEGTIQVIDTTTFSIAASIAVGSDPHDVAVSPDGQWVFAGSRWGAGLAVIDTDNNTLYTTVTGLGDLTGLEVAPDGSVVYACGQWSGVHVIDGVTFDHVTTVPSVGDTWAAAVTCDGSELYVGNKSSEVPVINTATFSVAMHIPTSGSGAHGIAICPQHVAGDVPWLSQEPSSGTVPAYSSTSVQVTFDATGVQPGIHTAEIVVHSNDPVMPMDFIPVTMTVEPTADMGRVTGAVSDAWTGQPLAATVELIGVYAMTASPDYTIWAPAGTYSLTAYTSGYFTTTRSVIITAGESVSEDLALEPAQARLEWAPAAVSATAVEGGGVIQTLIISNTGPLPLEIGLYEINPTPAERTLALVDLTGKRILYDRAHGEPGDWDYSSLISDAISAGAVISENWQFPIDATVLEGYDVLWVNCCGGTAWGYAELNAVNDWLSQGGAVFVQGESSPATDGPASIFGTIYQSNSCTSGTTTDIADHPISKGVGTVNVEWTCWQLAPGSGAEIVVLDPQGQPHIVAQEHNGGRMVVVASEDFGNWYIDEDDNRLLANNILGWLARPVYSDVPWLSVTPQTSVIPGHSSLPVTLEFDATVLSIGDYRATLAIEHNDPAQPLPVEVPVTMTVLPTAPSPNQIRNGSFETDLAEWKFGAFGGAVASLSRDESTAAEGSASAMVQVIRPATWIRAVQLVQSGLTLEQGQEYRLAFWAKASMERPVRVILRMSSTPWTQYKSWTAGVGTSWQRYEYTFTPDASDADAMLEFSLGQYASTVWLDGIELSGAVVGPSITVDKSADPASVQEPGGDVTFTVVVENTGAVAVTLNSLQDDIHGDLNNQGDCVVPRSIAVGESYTCSFNATVTGNAGDSETDTVTATASDGLGNVAQASDSATVTIAAPPSPNQIRNGSFETDLAEWKFGAFGGAVASLSRDESTAAEGSASAMVQVIRPESWIRAVQLVQSGLTLEQGQEYRLAFWAKASMERPVRVILRMSTTPWTQHESWTVDIGTSWQRYEYTFTADANDAGAMLEFSLGQYASTVWLDGIELTGAPVGPTITSLPQSNSIVWIIADAIKLVLQVAFGSAIG